MEVAAFPCNQFNSQVRHERARPRSRERAQEPGCEIDIKKFQQEKYSFEPDLYAKIDVNGSNASPLYDFLKKVSVRGAALITLRARSGAGRTALRRHQVELHQVPGRQERAPHQALRTERGAEEDRARHREGPGRLGSGSAK